MKRGLQVPLRVWHGWISPVFPPMCRFEPSCSCYADEALQKRRLLPALGLIARRLSRCHPFHPGGYDPVPDGPETPEPQAHPPAE